MSPRAASRLESIGFAQVHDYVAGKADWSSAGLPLEGTRGSEARVGAHLRRDVPTCRLDERLSGRRARVRAARWDTCFVVNDEQVVLGRLGRAALAGDDEVSVEDAMSPGPSTVRPSLELDRAVERMRRQKPDHAAGDELRRAPARPARTRCGRASAARELNQNSARTLEEGSQP